MFYAWDISIPSNTLEASPVTQTLKLTKGTITTASIKFPAGCEGLVKVRLLHQEAQLIPLTRGEWVTGEDEVVSAEVYYNLPADANTLKLSAANLDDTFDHTVTIRINLLSEEEASTAPLTRLLLRFLQRIGAI